MVEIRPATQEDLPQLSSLVQQEFKLQQQFDNSIQLNSDIDWSAFVSARLVRSEAEILVADKNGYLVGYIDIRVVNQGRSISNIGLMKWVRMLKHIFTRVPVSVFKARRYGFIDDIFVDASLQSTAAGIGVKLFNSSLVWFESRGVREVEAVISAGNNNALKFSQSMGGQLVKYSMRKTL